MSANENGKSSHGYGPAPDDPVAFDATQDSYGRGPIVLILAVVMIVAVGGVIFAVYEQGARSRGEPAVITADLSPEKVAPEDPGGAVIEHQDKFIYDQISGTERPQVEVLLPKSEEPMDLSGLRTVSTGDELVEKSSDHEDVATAALENEEAQVVTPRQKPEPEVIAEAVEDEKTVETLIEETSQPAPMPSTRSGGSAISGNYVVQVGAYDNTGLASNAWDAMSRKHSALLSNLRPDIQVADLGAKGTWYRLRVGPFDDKASATQLCQSLKSAGQDCLVRTP